MTEFRIAVEKIVSNLLKHNIMGGGVSDAQKCLIAAVEEGLVSPGLGTHISKEYGLGLDWGSEDV